MDGLFYQISFWVLAVITVLSALMVTTMQNLTRGVIFLVFFFLGIGGLYFLMQAEFLALVQVVVYAGAVAVLFAFVIMLTPRVAEREIKQSLNLGAGFILAALFLALVLSLLLGQPWPELAAPGAGTITLGQLGQALLGEYLLPFELVSVVLLVALVGAVVIAGRNAGRGERKS
ncbi:MAG: NADH-quinone oxidoreductase subunit J [Clostridia bacterium]|nr:MAG: NADH-quinone oxidoreductase subunit J [Clostridia bacterium]